MELARVRNFSDHTFKNYSRALELYTGRFGERIVRQIETYIAQIQSNQTLARHVNALESFDAGYLLR